MGQPLEAFLGHILAAVHAADSSCCRLSSCQLLLLLVLPLQQELLPCCFHRYQLTRAAQVVWQHLQSTAQHSTAERNGTPCSVLKPQYACPSMYRTTCSQDFFV